MNRARLIALVALFATWPLGAYAQSDVIDWLNQLSGPGPFHDKAKGFDLNVWCYPFKAASCYSNDGIDVIDNSGKSDAKWILTVGTSFASTGSQPLFKDDPTDVRDVLERTISTMVMYRANRVVDAGLGARFIRFSSDEGASFSFWRVGLVPARLRVTPFGLLNVTSGRASYVRRLIHLEVEAIWLHEGFSGADFNNTKTKFSVGNEYQTQLGFLVDGWALAGIILGHQ
jgi:hypothetical protein